MKKKIWILTLLAALMLVSCGRNGQETRKVPFVSITAEEAKAVMDDTEGYVILDVRTQEEYEQGHIPGAMVIPHTEVAARAETELPDKAQVILVYCRSGRRSKLAAQALAELGYTNVKEFGGIQDWPYGIE